jgi:hypothetical protein
MNTKPSILEKVRAVLPELFKLIDVDKLASCDVATLHKLKKVMTLATELPPEFKETINLDSSGRDFDDVCCYREEILRIIMGTNLADVKLMLIQQLREDMPKISG